MLDDTNRPRLGTYRISRHITRPRASALAALPPFPLESMFIFFIYSMERISFGWERHEFGCDLMYIFHSMQKRDDPLEIHLHRKVT